MFKEMDEEVEPVKQPTAVEAVFAVYQDAVEPLLTANVATEGFSPSATDANIDNETPSDPWLNDELLALVFS